MYGFIGNLCNSPYLCSSVGSYPTSASSRNRTHNNLLTREISTLSYAGGCHTPFSVVAWGLRSLTHWLRRNPKSYVPLVSGSLGLAGFEPARGSLQLRATLIAPSPLLYIGLLQYPMLTSVYHSATVLRHFASHLERPSRIRSPSLTRPRIHSPMWLQLYHNSQN